MPNFGVIGPKGRLTIPKKIRTRMGLKPGDRVEFVVRGKNAVVRRARLGTNPFEKYAGALGGFPGGVKEVIAWVRDMRDPDGCAQIEVSGRNSAVAAVYDRRRSRPGGTATIFARKWSLL